MSGHRPPPPGAVRYPLGPLADAMGVPLPSLVRKLGISGSSWLHYRDHGVSEKVADRLACKAGLHPYVVWPEMADDALEAAMVACRECGERFVPKSKRNVFCNPRCQKRQNSREQMRRRRARAEQVTRDREYARRYWRDLSEAARRAQAARLRRWRTENAARVAEQRRRYYEANRERILARQRAYYEANRERILARQRDRDRAKARERRQFNERGEAA